MKILATVIIFFCLLTKPVFAQNSAPLSENQTYAVGTVQKILEEQTIPIDEQDYYVQVIEVKDDKTGEIHTITSGSQFQPLTKSQRLRVGSKVIISEQQISLDGPEYVVNDVYRIPILVGLFGLFAFLVVFISGWQGLFSIGGMFFSLFVLVSYVVPHILAGENPLLVTILGASVVAVITMYLSHGFKPRVHIALLSMVLCLGAVGLLSFVAVQMGQFVGLGSEEAAFLQFGQTQHINLQGLLLAGILLGTLGILDDITLAQTSVVEQLKAVNKKLTFAELYNRGLTVGKDHIASLVNTLVFAYAGTSLPLFLLFTLYQTQPTWVVINSEMIAEELIRTLAGSIGLVMAVPITTFIASYYVTRPKVKVSKTKNKHHH